MAVLLMEPTVRLYFKNEGWRWLHMLSLSLCLSFCLTPIFRNIAWKFEVLDIPNDRKSHKSATPLLGGAAVFSAFFMALLINGIYSRELAGILVGTVLLFGVGLLDDVREIRASFKLLLQIAATLIVVSQGVVLSVFPTYWGEVGFILNTALTVFWVVGITNAMNFFDGMDGMASGLGAIISFFLGVVAFQSDQPFIGWIAAAMMGACLGFIPYNLLKNDRATIFLGDAGSTVIGFVLACVAVYGDWAEGRPVVALVSPLLIFWVLIFDMVYISVDRIVAGRVRSFRQWIEYVGKDHLHHRIAYVLGGARRAVFFIFLLNILLGVSSVVLRNATTVDALLILLQAAIIVIMISVLERRGRGLSVAQKNVEQGNRFLG